jgi:hypothetical protein
MSSRKVTAPQVARWKGRQIADKKRRKREERLRRNHAAGCAVFQQKLCTCRPGA